MSLAGWPLGPLRAYIAYMQAVTVCNAYTQNIGRHRARDLALPQGNPGSTTGVGRGGAVGCKFVATECAAAAPRCLADDMLLGTTTAYAGQPPETRNAAATANGSANTECSNFIVSKKSRKRCHGFAATTGLTWALLIGRLLSERALARLLKAKR